MASAAAICQGNPGRLWHGYRSDCDRGSVEEITMAQMVRAVVVDASSAERLVVKPVELPTARSDEATIRVTAVSLNRGEVRRALSQAETGARPGWDFAGIVEAPAADNSGPPPGTRVVGLLPSGAWAERVHAPAHSLAPLPEAVTDAQAATLPVAALTALHALRQGGLLIGRKVLVDGASGGVGHFACQLAAASGAAVWGQVRRPEFRALVAESCGNRVVLGADLKAAAAHGPFDLILDSVGGSALAAALTMLAPGGTCVHFGASEAAASTIESRDFFQRGGARLYGLTLFHELRRVESASRGLAMLAGLVADRVLRPHIAVEAPWSDIAAVARRLLDRSFAGKAVLHVS
jgi:NADPH:quinone reductase